MLKLVCYNPKIIKMNVIITGGRDFNDKRELAERCDYYFCKKENIKVIHANHWGAEHIGRLFAELRGHQVEVYDTDTIRLLDYADYIIVFWDGRDRQIYRLIIQAHQKGLGIRMEFYYRRPRLKKRFLTRSEIKRHLLTTDEHRDKYKREFDRVKKMVTGGSLPQDKKTGEDIEPAG